MPDGQHSAVDRFVEDLDDGVENWQVARVPCGLHQQRMRPRSDNHRRHKQPFQQRASNPGGRGHCDGRSQPHRASFHAQTDAHGRWGMSEVAFQDRSRQHAKVEHIGRVANQSAGRLFGTSDYQPDPRRFCGVDRTVDLRLRWCPRQALNLRPLNP